MELQQRRPFEARAEDILKENGDFFNNRMMKFIRCLEHVYDCLLAICGEPQEIESAFEKISKYLKAYSCKCMIANITIGNGTDPEDPRCHVFIISRRDHLKEPDKSGNWVPILS